MIVHRPTEDQTRVDDGASGSRSWVATEKIHAPTWCWRATEPRSWSQAQAWLDPGDGSSAGSCSGRPHPRRAAIFSSIAERSRACARLRELFGGCYPTRTSLGPRRVGRPDRIWYSPDVRFAAFDVLVEPEMSSCRTPSSSAWRTRRDPVRPVVAAPRSELERLPSATLRWSRLGSAAPIAGNLAEGLS